LEEVEEARVHVGVAKSQQSMLAYLFGVEKDGERLLRWKVGRTVMEKRGESVELTDKQEVEEKIVEEEEKDNEGQEEKEEQKDDEEVVIVEEEIVEVKEEIKE